MYFIRPVPPCRFKPKYKTCSNRPGWLKRAKISPQTLPNITQERASMDRAFELLIVAMVSTDFIVCRLNTWQWSNYQLYPSEGDFRQKHGSAIITNTDFFLSNCSGGSSVMRKLSYSTVITTDKFAWITYKNTTLQTWQNSLSCVCLWIHLCGWLVDGHITLGTILCKFRDRFRNM